MSDRCGVAIRFGRAIRHPAMLLLGVVAVLPLVAVDPAIVGLLLDPELIALIGTVGLALLRGDARSVLRRVAGSLPAVWLRVGLLLTREDPRSLSASTVGHSG